MIYSQSPRARVALATLLEHEASVLQATENTIAGFDANDVRLFFIATNEACTHAREIQ